MIGDVKFGNRSVFDGDCPESKNCAWRPDRSMPGYGDMHMFADHSGTSWRTELHHPEPELLLRDFDMCAISEDQFWDVKIELDKLTIRADNGTWVWTLVERIEHLDQTRWRWPD